MTGFGVAGFEDEQMMIQVEVRSLNSKFLDYPFVVQDNSLTKNMKYEP